MCCFPWKNVGKFPFPKKTVPGKCPSDMGGIYTQSIHGQGQFAIRYTFVPANVLMELWLLFYSYMGCLYTRIVDPALTLASFSWLHITVRCYRCSLWPTLYKVTFLLPALYKASKFYRGTSRHTILLHFKHLLTVHLWCIITKENGLPGG